MVPEILGGSLKTPPGPFNIKKKPGTDRVKVQQYDVTDRTNF